MGCSARSTPWLLRACMAHARPLRRSARAQARVGEGECEVEWEGAEASGPARTLVKWLSGAPEAESKCDDALIITLVVAARGYLDVPEA